MTSGIEARIAVLEPGKCPVARASAQTGSTASSVIKSQTGSDGHITEEFSLPREAAPDQPSLVSLGEFGDETVYRFERDSGKGCVCEWVNHLAGPLVETCARDGALFVTVRAKDRSTVREVVTMLQEQFDGVRLCYLCQPDSQSYQDPVVVNRAAMTERQREVLRTAHKMGYFDHPKGSNASEIANGLDISRSTFSKHLAAALRKLTDHIVQNDGDSNEVVSTP